jgi:hypothetical protein
MFHFLHKCFGPIRRFVYLPNNQCICILKTPGFCKDSLQYEFTPNELIHLFGERKIYEKNILIRTLQLDELIFIPNHVDKKTIQWEVKHGLTTFRCNISPSTLQDLGKELGEPHIEKDKEHIAS